MSALHASVYYPMKFSLAKNRNLDNIAMPKWRSFCAECVFMLDQYSYIVCQHGFGKG